MCTAPYSFLYPTIPHTLNRRLLGVCRGRVVYVESIARVYRLSLSGKILYHARLAAPFFVQVCVCVSRFVFGMWFAASTAAVGQILYHARLAAPFFVQVGVWDVVAFSTAAEHACCCCTTPAWPRLLCPGAHTCGAAALRCV